MSIISDTECITQEITIDKDVQHENDNDVQKIIHNDVDKIIDIIEEGKLSSMQIMKQYNISTYRFYKILHQYELVPKKLKCGKKVGSEGAKGPKNTKFKQLLYGTEEEQKAANILPEYFVVDDFIRDSKNGMKISELRFKYNLTLYQIRELRKKYDLTTRT